MNGLHRLLTDLRIARLVLEPTKDGLDVTYYFADAPDRPYSVREFSTLSITGARLRAAETYLNKAPQMTASARGRASALHALASRRRANETRERIPNDSLPAGAPMCFDCRTCGAAITVPEDYLTRPDLCVECMALKDWGWLDE